MMHQDSMDWLTQAYVLKSLLAWWASCTMLCGISSSKADGSSRPTDWHAQLLCLMPLLMSAAVDILLSHELSHLQIRVPLV